MHLVEALSVIITDLPPEHVRKALELVCLPFITPLQEITNQGCVALQQLPARQLTVHIDRLACIFSHAWDMRTMESLCRACKYAFLKVKTSGRCIVVTIGAMLEEIQALYQQHNQPYFLYLSSQVIKIFGNYPSCANYLRSLNEALFSHTTKLLTAIKDFTARPDIADDCFLLASRCIRYYPDLFIPPLFPSLIDCSMIGATIQHRKYRSIIDAVVLPRGATLTRILIASLTGALPSSHLEEGSYVLLALTRTYGVKVLEWAKGSISLITSAAITEVESASFLQALSDAASGSNSPVLQNILEELSDVKVQEMVQGALRPLDLRFSAVS